MKLRPMTMDDAIQMLEWKNYPETRRFAIASHEEIALKDHVYWLKDNIQYFQVVMEENVVAGAIRIQDKEISIWIDRKFWGCGMATKIIKQVSKRGFTAKIVDGNIGSMRVFIKSGYLPIEHKDNHYIFQK